MSTHLAGGRLNVAIVQETMRKELLNLLQLCEGPKVSLWTIFEHSNPYRPYVGQYFISLNLHHSEGTFGLVWRRVDSL